MEGQGEEYVVGTEDRFAHRGLGDTSLVLPRFIWLPMGIVPYNPKLNLKSGLLYPSSNSVRAVFLIVLRSRPRSPILLLMGRNMNLIYSSWLGDRKFGCGKRNG